MKYLSRHKIALLVTLLPAMLFAQTINDLLPKIAVVGKTVAPPAQYGYSPISVYTNDLPYGSSILAEYSGRHLTNVVPHTLQNLPTFSLDDNAILTIGNGNTEMEEVKKRVQFNVKHDDLSSICYVASTRELVVLNHANKPCDMSAFDVTSDSEGCSIYEGNYVQINATVFDFALNRYPRQWNILVTHRESGTQVAIPCSITFEHAATLAPQSGGDGGTAIFALVTLKSDEQLYALVDLESGKSSVIQLPYMITAYGENGRDGTNGANGRNGTNERNWTDSNGKAHHIAGTRGTAGGNGTSGTDGGDSGSILMCIPVELAQTDFLHTVRMVARKGFGGKGGAAGRGGRHGTGSGAIGRAKDGVAGSDGEDGRLGRLIYVVADTQELLKKLKF